jgi:Fic family protein
MQGLVEYARQAAVTPVDPVVAAAVLSFGFVYIHPFEDGNGRIARAVADMALARSEGSSQRFYSMSSQIRAERAAYYDVLERTQRGTTDVTEWMTWFLACLSRSIEAAGTALAAVLAKAHFWERAGGLALNERQPRVLNRVLDGFEGKLTTSKWAKLAKCSQDTALRDMTILVDHGLLARNPGGGRNTSYRLVTDP